MIDKINVYLNGVRLCGPNYRLPEFCIDSEGYLTFTCKIIGRDMSEQPDVIEIDVFKKGLLVVSHCLTVEVSKWPKEPYIKMDSDGHIVNATL